MNVGKGNMTFLPVGSTFLKGIGVELYCIRENGLSFLPWPKGTDSLIPAHVPNHKHEENKPHEYNPI